MKAFYRILIIVFTVSIFTGCKDDKEEPIVKGYYDGNTTLTTSKSLKATDIKSYFEQKGQTDLAALAKHDIKLFKITYKTALDGDSIIASGMVAVPVPNSKKESFPFLSYQHGVIYSNSQAPSVNPQDQLNELVAFTASTGFIVIIPDYIGFGSSNKFFHPFMEKKYATNAVIDFIRASKEFIANQKPCKTNSDIYLSGYGQGAHATLATLKEIEMNAVNYTDLKIKASTCCSGAYNLTDFHDWMVKNVKYDQPWYLAYILESYKQYDNLDIDYSAIFNTKYVSLFSKLIDGVSSGDQMNSYIGTKSLDELLNPDFRDPAVYYAANDVTYTKLKQVLEDNSISTWNLKSSLALYYGKEDIWIPAEQTLNIFNDFRKMNVTSNLKINSLEGLNHETAVIPSFAKSVIWFKSL